MKQVLIVNSATQGLEPEGGASSTYTPTSIGPAIKGAIGFYKLSDTSAWASAALKEDFAIVLGRGADAAPLIIPEVDYDTLQVSVAKPTAAVAYQGTITIPTPTANDNYTLVLTKLGKHFNERTNYTVTTFIPINKEVTANELAAELGKQLQDKAAFENLNIEVTVTGADIDIEGLVPGEAFALKAADGLFGESVSETPAVKATGDKAYIQDLASRGAAGKGFNDVYEDGPTIYPGYPEDVEDTTYDVITLRFAVGRKASKTRDERASQLVHICVPVGATDADTIATVLGVTLSSD